MASKVFDILQPSANDIKMLALAQCQLSAKKVEPGMKGYVYGKAVSGLQPEYLGSSIIDLKKTWDKLVLAARVLAAVDKPAEIYCVGQRTYAQRAIIKFAKAIGATAAPGRFTPGQFTNQMTGKSKDGKFVEPRILMVADPRLDSQAVKEASYVNIPTIAFCGADSNLQYIDVAIPGNNKGKEALGLLYWMLAREVLRLRGEIPREEYKNDRWAEQFAVDLFFHKDEEEINNSLREEENRQEQFRDDEEFDPQFTGAPDGQFQGQTGYDQTEDWGNTPGGFDQQQGMAPQGPAVPSGYDENQTWADQGQQPQYTDQQQQQPDQGQQQQQFGGNSWDNQPRVGGDNQVLEVSTTYNR
eukprot:UN24908